MLRSLCLLTGSFVVSATLLMAQKAGRISGTVISEDGV